MRLGQIARKIDKPTKEIVSFLAQKDIIVEDQLNTKLDDNAVDLVLSTLSPSPETLDDAPTEIIEEVETPEIKEEAPIEEEITVEVYEMSEEEAKGLDQEEKEEKEQAVEQEPAINTEETIPTKTLTVAELIEIEGKEENPEGEPSAPADNNKDAEEEQIIGLSRDEEVPEDIEADLIKAPKIELQGIKVVGKIELPEKSEKEKKKDEARAAAKEANAYKTPSVKTDGVHPSKLVKEIKIEKEFLSKDKIIQEEAPVKRKKAKEIKAEKKAKSNKKHQKNKPKIIDEATLAKQKERERRKRKREREKNKPKKKQTHWLRQLWDAIK